MTPVETREKREIPFDPSLRQVLRKSRTAGEARVDALARQKFLQEIKNKMEADPGFFESLPPVSKEYGFNLRVYTSNGIKTVVKRCGSDREYHAERHGAYPEQYDAFFKEYKKALRNGEFGKNKSYWLAFIRSFGTIKARQTICGLDGNHSFIVMEHLNEVNWLEADPYSYARAQTELAHDLTKIMEKHCVKKPQECLLTLGRTNEGTWVFALPRDYE